MGSTLVSFLELPATMNSRLCSLPFWVLIQYFGFNLRVDTWALIKDWVRWWARLMLYTLFFLIGLGITFCNGLCFRPRYCWVVSFFWLPSRVDWGSFYHLQWCCLFYHWTRWDLYLCHSTCRPVLKHGPRSLTYAQVFGWQAHGHNESEIGLVLLQRPGRDYGFILVLSLQ